MFFFYEKQKILLINVSNKFDSSSAVSGNELSSDCCLRRFNNSKRCSSSNTNSLLRSFKNEVFDERCIRFDDDDDDDEDRIAK
jgi:hypothetical protein